MGVCALAIGISDLKCESSDSDNQEFELPEEKQKARKGKL